MFEIDTDSNSEIDEEVPMIPSDNSDSPIPSTSFSSQEQPNAKECVVCYVNPPKILYIPCGHYATCVTCHQQILAVYQEKLERERDEDAHPVKKCPVCNSPFAQAVEVENIY